MRALIVDDEPVARRILREELELLAVKIAGEAENGEAALLQIFSAKPDVVFLDIQMPVMDGFELLANLSSERAPAIIMVTAFDHYAIQAFEAGAIDYLLKPIGPQRLATAIERARQTAGDHQKAVQKLEELQRLTPHTGNGSARVRKLVGRSGQDYILLSIDEIYALQADGDLTWIITAQRRYLATQNLRALERRLLGDSFRRIHRNALVNVEQIRKLSMTSSQRWLVTLSNGQEFVVSKRQAKNVRDVLSW